MYRKEIKVSVLTLDDTFVMFLYEKTYVNNILQVYMYILFVEGRLVLNEI